MKWPLRYQFVATYLLVSVFTACVIYALVVFTSEQRISQLKLNYQTEEMIAEIVSWYEAEKDWRGFEAYFVTLHPQYIQLAGTREDNPNPVAAEESNSLEPGETPPRGPEGPKRHGIVSQSNVVLANFLGFRVGDVISSAYLREAQPITVEGTLVAWIVPPEATGLSLASQRELFQDNFTQIFKISLIVGVIVSLIFGQVFSRWLLKPMDRLYSAMSSMAKGRLYQQVPVTSNNELAELTLGFNKMSESLTQADQKRRRLTADITHDLGTPIQVISGYIEMAQNGDVELNNERLKIVRNELKLVERLIRDMNLLAKTDSQSLSLQLSEVPLDKLLVAVHQRFLPKCEEKQIILLLNLESTLPSLYLDEARMLQVLGNLLENAVRHTPSRGKIVVSGKQCDGYCELRIKDSGCGVAPEKLEHIFDRFYRIEPARSGSDGNSGLGLTIAKGILDMHGAEIKAHSDGANGTEFIIRMPHKINTA
ncbi:sensor histidine kinase [Vibrio ulleungensis]|uniref:histidine kinase n=1 Tax=Vibrio ulleungensis TaxID=2807619 RepID=A0ABS2HLC4_9VIBR|nr:HAMP domain-containing sensor histidine kinase [Vibrio ulleungensis]MBM7036616.1 HAMP domain-containing histidine kinase [Vibrio ulleungensis]